MGYSGNMYAQATEVITSEGDLRRGDSSGNPERLAIGSTNQVLQSNGTTESWATLSTAASVLTTQGDILVEGASGLERLGQSTDGFLLTTKGAGANPVWAAAAGGGTWSTLASTKLTSANATLDVSFTAKEYLLFQVKLIVTSASSAAVRYTLNSDTGNNYDYSYTLNDTSSAFSTNQSEINPAGVDFTASKVGFMNIWVHNVAAQTKLGLSHFMSNQANINSTEGAFEWDNTSDQITSAQFFNDTGGYPSGQYDTGSEVVVLGYDP